MNKSLFCRLGTALIPAVAVIALSALPAYADQPPTSPPRSDTGTATVNCGDDGSAATVSWSPTILWPPNQTVVPVTISFADNADNDGSAIGIHVDSITSTQGSASTGVGNAGTGTEHVTPATAQIGLTAVRAGADPAGNVYTINVTCSEPSEGESGTATLTVIVPHDLGQQ